jgi:hypothetical protein
MELMVAMAVSALLAGGLYMSLRTAFGLQKASTDSLDASRTAALAMDLLSNDLQNTMQAAGAGVAASTSTVTATTTAGATATTPPLSMIGNFEGNANSDERGNPASDLTFYSNTFAPDHVDGNGEVKCVQLAVETRPNGEHVLVRRVAGNLLNPNTVSASQTSVYPVGLITDTETICRNVAGFGLRYYNGSSWVETWDSTALDNTVPTAVEVTLLLQRPGSDPNQSKPLTFVRVFPIAVSAAALDPNVNTGGLSQ